MDRIDKLLRCGEIEAAWHKADGLLEIEPTGAMCERLLLYLLPLTFHYGYPNKMEELIGAYNSRLKSSTSARPKDRAFIKAIRLVFTALTDQSNEGKIAVQLEAIDWSKLTNNSILQTFRFNIENHRQNRKSANEAIVCARRSANNFYDKALIAAALCKHEAKENRFYNSLSIAKRSLKLLKTDNSLRAGFLKAQLLGHIGKINQALGNLILAEEYFYRMNKRLGQYRSFTPGQQYLGNLTYGAKTRRTSPTLLRTLIIKEIRSLSTKWAYQRNRLIHAFFSLNALAIDRRDFKESWSILNSIRRLLPTVNQDELTAYYYRDLAKVLIYEGGGIKRNPGMVKAILLKAESSFSKLGKNGWHGKATTLLIKGEWLLQKKKYDSLMICIRQSSDMALLLQDHHLLAYPTLLKSFLLLNSDLNNKVEIYKAIQSEIHTIRHPDLLFRILSNLYLYSWDLPDQLHTTSRLIKEIQALQTSFPKAIFQKLWKEHISSKVFSRLLPNSALCNTEPQRLC